MVMLSLTDDEKDALLKISRLVLEEYILNRKIVTVDQLTMNLSNKFKVKAGGFVTLHKDGNLRGCIGEILPEREILKVVMDRTISASSEDPRFPPVSLAELAKINIEISILTPPCHIETFKNIEIGKHGIILEKSGHCSVFLPQVAPEQGWNLETTLNHLSLKAGLSETDWKTDCNFQTFEAIAFQE